MVFLITDVTQPRAVGKARIAMSATGEKPVTTPPKTTELSTDNGSIAFPIVLDEPNPSATIRLRNLFQQRAGSSPRLAQLHRFQSGGSR